MMFIKIGKLREGAGWGNGEFSLSSVECEGQAIQQETSTTTEKFHMSCVPQCTHL